MNAAPLTERVDTRQVLRGEALAYHTPASIQRPMVSPTLASSAPSTTASAEQGRGGTHQCNRAHACAPRGVLIFNGADFRLAPGPRAGNSHQAAAERPDDQPLRLSHAARAADFREFAPPLRAGLLVREFGPGRADNLGVDGVGVRN